MFKVCTTAIVLGLTIGMVASVQQVVGDLLHDLDDIELTMATFVPVIGPTTAHSVPSAFGEADRLVQVAKDLKVSGERLHALAQAAASDCDGSACVEIMISRWGPAWAERVLRETNFASTR